MSIVSADLSDSTVDEIEKYMDENDINRSEAVRQLLRAGIEAETGTSGLTSALGIRN
jgi:metal-responsive CopG/Arc/MetJ family transcriptional regulator